MSNILTRCLPVVVLLSACNTSQRALQQRAAELCGHLPVPEQLQQSREYLTDDLYAVLDTLYRLPEHEAMDHEWLHYFVTGNGSTITDCEVTAVSLTDATHAVATIRVRQTWEDGSFDPETDTEEHTLLMERVGGKWLMADFDGHKADCARHIAINRYEQSVRRAISTYLKDEIGRQYRQGDICVPTMMIVAEEDCETEILFVYGDFWVYWYAVSGDTLRTVSGGNHAGRMTISEAGDSIYVSAFVQTVDGAGNDAGARQIFGKYYDIYQNIHSSEAVREAVRKQQLQGLTDCLIAIIRITVGRQWKFDAT